MTYAVDTLAYARRLRDAGISTEQAEAHAEAAREFMMAELALALDHMALKLTVRFGGTVAIAVAILATIIKL